MSRPLLVLLCVSGLESAAFVRRVLARLDAPNLECALLYVIDERPPAEIGYTRRSRPRPLQGTTAIAGTHESDLALDVLGEAAAAVSELGLGPNRVRRYIARGRPAELIVQHAIQLEADLVAIGSRHRGAPVTVPPDGPPSIGPVAQYVLDRAPCDVLLLR